MYYSRALVNGVEDTSIIKSSTELDFGAALKTVGVDYVIEYDLTNASSAFDAQVTINCSASTEYFSINNEFDDSTPIGARQTRTGTMTLRKIQTVSGDEQSNTISCDIVATPVERTEEGVGEIPIPLENPYYIGREISIGEEKFNIISDNGDTISMLAQYNLGDDFKQTSTQTNLKFGTSGYEYNPGPKEVDIYTYGYDFIIYLNNYVSFLASQIGDDSLFADLVSMKSLGDLGCYVPEDYAMGEGGWNCNVSPYKDWLVNGQNAWTKSAGVDDSYIVWVLLDSGDFYYGDVINSTYGVRPVITISKGTLVNYN